MKKLPISVDFLKPPNLLGHNAALGQIAGNKSIMVAAFADPIPTFIIEIPCWLVAACAGLLLP